MRYLHTYFCQNLWTYLEKNISSAKYLLNINGGTCGSDGVLQGKLLYVSPI